MSVQNASPMLRALAAGVEANVPTLLWGDPGEGKTATIESSGRSWARMVETVVGSNRESTDFLGVMIEDEGVVRYSTFQWTKNLTEASKGLLFLDELTTASPNTQKAMLRVLQERVVGETELPETVSIVAAANDPEVAVDGMDLPSPVANRVMHLDWVFDTASWLDNVGTDFRHVALPSFGSMLAEDPGANYAVVSMKVAAFLKTLPKMLKPGVPKDPAQAGKAWPSPRSWHNAIKVMSYLRADDEDATFMVVKGCVGEAAAKQYVEWLSKNDLIDPLEAIEDPTKVKWATERADRLFALVSGITSLGMGDPNRWGKALTALTMCAEEGKPDVALTGARKLLNVMPAGVRIPKASREAFRDLLERTQHRMVKAA